MIKNKIFKTYLQKNILLNVLLLIAISIIISFQLTSEMPVILNLNTKIVNYYYELIVNLSSGYIVSLIFYIIVVFYPEEKKKELINTKTSILFARLQTYLRNYIFEILEAFNIEFNTNDDLRKSFIDEARKCNAFDTLNKPSHNDIFGKDQTSFNIVISNSKKIIALKNELIPFLMYINTKELDFYTDLEEIFIFENINNLQEGFAVEPLFYDDFEYVVQAYIKVQEIVGASKIQVCHKKDTTN